MATINNTLLIALFDGVGGDVAPTANFTPASGFPLSNLQNSQLFSRTRTPDLTGTAQLTWDFGAAVEADVFALFGTNATLAAQRRFQAADNSGITTNVVQSGSGLGAAFDLTLGTSRLQSLYVPPWGRSLIYLHPTSFTKRYVRWHQTDIANPDGFQEWGIARMGLSLQFEGGFTDWRPIPRLYGPTGSEKVARGHELTLHLLTKAEAYDLQAFMLSSLSTRRMLVIPEPLAPGTWPMDALWCTFEGAYVREPAVPDMSYTNRKFRVVVTFREADR